MIDRMRELLNRLYSRDGFRGPVLTLLSGSAFALALGYFAQIVLRRLFTPEDFGTAAYFVSLLSLPNIVASLRFEDAIMLPEKDEEAADIVRLSLLLMTAVVVILGVLALWSSGIASVLSMPRVGPWLWLLPPTLFCMRLSKISEYWLSRKKLFRQITAGDVSNKVVMVSSRLAAGFSTSLGAGGLIGGFTLGHIVSSMYYLTRLRRLQFRFNIRNLHTERIRYLIRRYRRFPIFSMPSAFLNTFVTHLPILFIPFFFDDSSILGFFDAAFRVLAVPLSFLGVAVSHVFFVHAAEASRNNTLAGLTQTVHARLVMIGVFPTLALILAGPHVFAFLFGETWRLAGSYEQLMAVWFFLMCIASPLTPLFDVLERQRNELYISATMFVSQVVVLLIGGLTGNVMLTIFLLGIVGALTRLLHITIMLRLAGVGFRQALAPYLRYTGFCLPSLLAIFLALPSDEPWLITAVVVGGGVLYAVWVIWKDRLLTLR